MEGWVLSIVGTVALGVLVDIIMPEGDMAKYIKGVFAIVVITVVVAPLPTFFLSIKNGHIIPPNYGEDVEVDSEFIEYIDSEENRQIEAKIGNILMNYGVNCNKITVFDREKDNVIDFVEVVVEDEGSRAKVIDILYNVVHINVKEVSVVARRSG